MPRQIYVVFPLMSWFQVEQSSSHRLLLCTSDLNPFKAGLHFTMDLSSPFSSFPHKPDLAVLLCTPSK